MARTTMAAQSSLHPAHPERVCWGCDKLCPAENLACGNGTIRASHPAELFGGDWLEWVNEKDEAKHDIMP